MKNLTAIEILNVWEQGLDQPLLQRALILLITAFPEMQPDTLAKLTIGQRDRRLLQLREHLFGTQLVNTAVCPQCAERIEWNNKVSDLLMMPTKDIEVDQEFQMFEEGYSLCFRLPNSLDVAAVINSVDTEKISQHLLSRCLVNIEHSGEKCLPDQLPDSVIQKLNQRIESLDPQAEICIDLLCPVCEHGWEALFDISSFLWTEINEWAERMLNAVHKLASAYGWTERDILGLSPVRRQLYLGMLG